MAKFETLAETSEEKNTAENSWLEMERLIEGLKIASRFKQEREGGRVFMVAESGEKFELQKISHKDQKDTKKIATEMRKFLGGFFEEEENDSVADYATAIRENLGKFLAVRDGKGKIVSIMNTQLSKLENPRGGAEGAELIIWYVVTSPEHQGKGIATELYKNAYEAALNEVRDDKLEFKAVVGETDPDVEGYLNKFGRKRVYFENSKTGNFEEVPYMAPPSETDEDPSAEHLMVKFLDNHSVSDKDEALKLIRGIYNQYLRPQYFEDLSKEEAVEYRAKVEGVYANIAAALDKAKDGRVYLWSKEERETKAAELKKRKKKIQELEIE